MAEIKNTFTQGKMNKDLDERLLPVGQYRHAVNVQVSTSDASDVGSIQNILGNKGFNFFVTNPLIQNNINNLTCVGCVSDEKNNKVYWLITLGDANYILEFEQPNIFRYVLVDTNNILRLNSSNTITGINIIDGLLFFTDGVNEPKKINIQRCIQGTTDQTGQTHTKLVVDGTVTSQDLLEEHITVIKKAPKYSPVLQMSDSLRKGNIGGVFKYAFSDTDSVGDIITVDLINSQGDNNFNLNVSDKIVIDHFINITPPLPLNDYLIRGVITNIDGSAIPNGIRLSFEITSFSPQTPRGTNELNEDRNFALSLSQQTEKLFENKFPRFAIRYRYEDNEYSSFGPFSEVAFLPGSFDYHPRKGYNIGMTNRLSELVLKEFITRDIPSDVVAVDILYKEVGSNNIYVLDTLRPDDPENIDFEFLSGPNIGTVQQFNPWNHPNQENISLYLGTTAGIDVFSTGYYSVKSETIYSLLPSNQLLRSYDNVPRKALSQEITGNRIIYANYTQNYNLSPTTTYGNFKTDFDISLTSFFDTALEPGKPYKSLKSLREYQIGIVYSDEYGRETPVLTNANATIQTVKSDADASNQLSIRVENDPPLFAKSFKFYIKETSGEYYNMAMDRWYNAEDGNIWLSFPSVDRNKVDIETYLILKKGIDSDELVKEKARYKVIDISNEAPDYIKRKKLPFGKVRHDAAINNVFAAVSSNLPLKGESNFKIQADSLLNTSAEDIGRILDEPGNELFVRFEDETNNKRSKDYRITSFNRRALLSTNNTINFKINEDFESDVDFVVANPAQPASTLANDNIDVVFIQYKPENQARFDGRFFVKIHNDIDASTNLSSGFTKSSNYKVVSQRTFHFLAANHVNLHKNSETIIGSGPSASLYNLPNSHDLTAANGVDWDVMIDYPQNNIYDSFGTLLTTASSVINEYFTSTFADLDYWYTFTAFFRQKGTYDINDRVNHNSTSTDQPENFEDIWYINGHKYAGKYDAFQNNIQSASHLDDYGINGNKIEIGFGGLEPGIANSLITYDEFNFIETQTQTQQGYSITGTHFQNKTVNGWSNGNGDIYRLGDEVANDNYGLEQIDFISKLKVGSKIRWQNDPRTDNIYTIINIEKINVLRYTDNPGDIVFRRPENFQTNYILTLDKPIQQQAAGGWHPVHDGGMNGYSVNTDAYVTNSNFEGLSTSVGQVLEILESVDEESLMPENPAIWETEPKEETPLNIYYEASKDYPIELNDENITSIIKAGSKVRIFDRLDTGTFFPEEYNVVFHLEGNGLTMDRDLNTLHLAPQGTSGPFNLLEITRDNTSILVSVIDFPYGGNIIVSGTPFATSIQSVQLSKDINYSNIELPYFNCYSFGNGVESNRIGDTFNKSFIDNGVIASTTIDPEGIYEEENREHGLIFSGLYNSTSGVNNLNQFITAENITKELNPVYGSIQKLFSRANAQGDLIAFCENRVLNILANKDALFNADGSANVVSTTNVLGQATPFTGDYGISQNPESFASESYRAYFTDKRRGAVLRLSRDGITNISDTGMSDWFGDNLKDSNFLVGSYDQEKGEYNLTIKYSSLAKDSTSAPFDKTLSFDEKVNGWTSFKSFTPETGVSCFNKYYTFFKGQIYEHHNESSPVNSFYNSPTKESVVSFIFNQEFNIVKDFRAINYDGTQARLLSDYIVNSYKNINDVPGWYVNNVQTNLEEGYIPYFVEKENKWFNYIKGNNFNLNTIGSNPDTRKFSVQGIGIAKVVDATPVQPPPPPPPPPPPGPTNNIYGCTDPQATNYDPTATVDDGSCTYAPPPPPPPGIPGCTDPTAVNFSASATVDDGSCVYLPPPPPPPPNVVVINPDVPLNEPGTTFTEPGFVDEPSNDALTCPIPGFEARINGYEDNASGPHGTAFFNVEISMTFSSATGGTPPYGYAVVFDSPIMTPNVQTYYNAVPFTPNTFTVVCDLIILEQYEQTGMLPVSINANLYVNDLAGNNIYCVNTVPDETKIYQSDFNIIKNLTEEEE